MVWSNRQPRKKNPWTTRESMVVIRIMKKKLAYAKTLILIRNEGVDRSLQEIKQHYKNVRANYLVIRRWEQASGERSYFDMSLSERRQRALPLRFNRQFYDLLSNRIPSLDKAHEEEKAPSGTTMVNSLVSLTDEVSAELEVESRKADSDSEVETTMAECPLAQEADIASEIGSDTIKEEDPKLGLVSGASTGTMKEEDPVADLINQVDRRTMKEEDLMSKEEDLMVSEAENVAGSGAVQETENEEEDPANTYTTRWSQEEDQIDKIAFADGCLHFDDDNVADGYLKAPVEEKHNGSGQVRILPKEEVELVEERTKETLRASEWYDKAIKLWRAQKVQMDQHRMELLMKADASFVFAMNQLACAVRRLIDKTY